MRILPGNDPAAARRLANFQAVLSSNPLAPVLDPLPGIRPLLNRAQLQVVLADMISEFSLDVALPKWYVVCGRGMGDGVWSQTDHTHTHRERESERERARERERERDR
jgi:hypothetical protein